MPTTILATMRDEAPFITEWLAYHRAIGFDRFVIFSNDCTDGTDHLLSALDAAGLITHIPHSPAADQPIAEQISKAALQRDLFSPDEWMIWLDADEFLNIHTGDGRIETLIEKIGPARGICLSWRLFGDSAYQGIPPALISNDFTGCAKPGVGWQNVKTLFRFDADVTELFQHKPILSSQFWAEGGTFLAPSGKQIPSSEPLMKLWKAGRKRGKIAEDQASWALAQINHYAVRTEAIFASKQARGRIGAANAGGKARYTNAYFRDLNRNEDQDTSILRWEQATQTERARIEALIADRFDFSKIYATDKTSAQTAKPTAKPEPLLLVAAVVQDHPQTPPPQNPPAATDQTRRSSQTLAALIAEVLRPATVVDVGCGTGLLASFMQINGATVLGVDGAATDPADRILPADHYQQIDLEQPIALDRRFDLCTCIEIAAQLEPSRADGLVADLCALSDAVLFSAAIAGQGGQGHKNEQWQDYWAQKFVAQGYEIFDPFRNRLWRDEKILPPLQQNLLLYIKTGTPLADGLAADKIGLSRVNMILPTYHQKIMTRARKAFRQRLNRAGKE